MLHLYKFRLNTILTEKESYIKTLLVEKESLASKLENVAIRSSLKPNILK